MRGNGGGEGEGRRRSRKGKGREGNEEMRRRSEAAVVKQTD
jgi:hypothetical protein